MSDYTIAVFGSNEQSKPLSLSAVQRKQARMMRQAGRWRQFRLRKPNGPWGTPRSYADTLQVSKHRLIVEDDGFTVVVGYEDRLNILPLCTLRKVDAYPAPADVYATESVQRIYSATFEQFDFVFNNGLYVNKPYLHGTKPPDAWDAGVRFSTSPQAHSRVMQVFDYWHEEAALFYRTGGREGLPINGAIGMEFIFGPYAASSGNLAVRHYTGTPHVTHGHVSGDPVPPGHGGEV